MVKRLLLSWLSIFPGVEKRVAKNIRVTWKNAVMGTYMYDGLAP